MRFTSKLSQAPISFGNEWTQSQIKLEPMFFNSNLEFAYEHGGPIMKSFISALPLEWRHCDCVVDSRVHMLMPGWYPAIPGYHHDDVPRPPIPVGQHFATAGQPDYKNMRYRADHVMGLVNGDICPTEFALGECDMPEVDKGKKVYKVWHDEVVRLLESGGLQRWSAPSGQLIFFDWQTFHTGTKAVGNGWRWFCRVSRNTDRTKTITNEIRSQVQVYLELPTEGW